MSKWHGYLLDGKRVEDDPLALYGEFRWLIPEHLHEKFDQLWDRFTEELAGCDISKDPCALSSTFGLIDKHTHPQHIGTDKPKEYWMITVRREQLHLRAGTQHVQYFSFAINEHPYDYMKTLNHTAADIRTNGVLLSAIPIDEGCYNAYKDVEFSCN